ncbi:MULTISPECIES: hypothetical protein [unclassified Luteimonas]
MNQLTTTSVTSRNVKVAQIVQRPLPAFERRERDFGIGYGNSSGYASGKRYTPATATARFRFA